jgi:hypothetical protein
MLQSELSLDAHTLSVSVPASLSAEDPAHQGFFSAPAGSPSRVRIGRLQTNGALRLGTLTFAKNDLRGLAYELWLDGTRDEWRLELTEILAAQTQTQGGPAPAAIGTVSLVKQRASSPSPSLVPALIPSSRDAGRLVLRWGDVEAGAELQFTEEQRIPLGGGGQPNQPVNRKHDEDTTAVSRILTLTQRNETAFVAAKGTRLSVTFARTLGKGQRSSTGTAGVTGAAGLDVTGLDFSRLMSTPDGAVVQLTEAAVPRLITEAAVRFGRAQLRSGNQTPGHPGAYGLWLKRAGRGWRLVFSNEPDTWGSQYDRKHDAGEVELTHTEAGDATRPFSVALVPTSATRGRLVISWGPHDWATDWTL